MRQIVIALCTLSFTSLAIAQETPEAVPFAGGEITITQTPDFEKVVAFDGVELARDYVAFIDRVTEVWDKPIALILVGPGGNACGARTMILYPGDDGKVKSDITPDECGTPLASVAPDGIHFVPLVRPGEAQTVLRWTPYEGFTTAGEIRFAPEKDTVWADLDPASMSHPMDLFRNAEFHDKAASLLGGDLASYTLGLGTSSAPQKDDSGYWTSEGCVPHACGSADTFLAVNLENKTIYFAQFGSDGPKHWPTKGYWPSEVLKLIENR